MKDTPLQLPETAPLTGPELAAKRMERMERTIAHLVAEVARLKELLAPLPGQQIGNGMAADGMREGEA